MVPDKCLGCMHVCTCPLGDGAECSCINAFSYPLHHHAGSPRSEHPRLQSRGSPRGREQRATRGVQGLACSAGCCTHHLTHRSSVTLMQVHVEPPISHHILHSTTSRCQLISRLACDGGAPDQYVYVPNLLRGLFRSLPVMQTVAPIRESGVFAISPDSVSVLRKRPCMEQTAARSGGTARQLA